MPKAIFSSKLLKVSFITSLFVLAVTVSGCKRDSERLAGETPDSVYIQTGDMIASATFDSLRHSLMRAMGAQGIEGAITFCNVNASVLTNAFADSVTVRRTALRYRNPINKPDSLENAVLMSMSSGIPSSKSPTTVILREAGRKVHYFKPIMMQSMCLSCHGNPKGEIKESTMIRIRELYPDDRAINFREGDLRGVWHILFSE